MTDRVSANPQPLNEDPQQYLGEEIDHFSMRFQPLNRWLALILGILLILDALVFSLVNTFSAINAIQSHGRAVILARVTDPLFAMCLVLPLGIALIIIAAVNWHNGLTLYKNGFTLSKHHREKTWLWHSVSRFDNQILFVKFSRSTIGKKRKIILEDDQQNRLQLQNQYERMDELIDHLRESILSKLFIKSKIKLRNGMTLTFHKHLKAVREGLLVDEILLPWGETQILIDKKGKVTVSHEQDEKSLFKSKIRRIRNLDVLMYLQENPPTNKYYSSPR